MSAVGGNQTLAFVERREGPTDLLGGFPQTDEAE